MNIHIHKDMVSEHLNSHQTHSIKHKHLTDTYLSDNIIICDTLRRGHPPTLLHAINVYAKSRDFLDLGSSKQTLATTFLPSPSINRASCIAPPSAIPQYITLINPTHAIQILPLQLWHQPA